MIKVFFFFWSDHRTGVADTAIDWVCKWLMRVDYFFDISSSSGFSSNLVALSHFQLQQAPHPFHSGLRLRDKDKLRPAFLDALRLSIFLILPVSVLVHAPCVSSLIATSLTPSPFSTDFLSSSLYHSLPTSRLPPPCLSVCKSGHRRRELPDCNIYHANCSAT